MTSTLLALCLVGQFEIKDVEQANKVINALQPELTDEQAMDLSWAVVVNAPKAGIPWTKFLAVLFQESSLWLDPKGCMEGKKCHDYGVGQVNWRTWGEELNLDRYKLLTDYAYSVKVSAEVFAHYHAKYSKKDPKNWWGFYHSKTPSLKRAYQARVRGVHAKIVGELEVEPNESRVFDISESDRCVFGPGEKTSLRSAP
jgi:hypothetical protein